MSKRVAAIFAIPIHTVSESNQREHWAVKAKRVKSHRNAAYLIINGHCRGVSPDSHITITLTRLGKRELDSDNLASSMKATRDGIADALGIDDGDKRLTWNYQQERAKDYSVVVKVEVE